MVAYVKQEGRLPRYYITKKEARSKGWVASEGNICEVLPGRAIGGDVFTNRERKLPQQKGEYGLKAILTMTAGAARQIASSFQTTGSYMLHGIITTPL